MLSSEPLGLTLHRVASVDSADVLKSRLMSTRVTNPGSNALEATSIGVAREIWQHEGVRGFFRGVLPAYARIGPIIFLQMPIVEALRSAFGVRAL